MRLLGCKRVCVEWRRCDGDGARTLKSESGELSQALANAEELRRRNAGRLRRRSGERRGVNLRSVEAELASGRRVRAQENCGSGRSVAVVLFVAAVKVSVMSRGGRCGVG